MNTNSKIQLGILNDNYGALLTEKQRSIVDFYCNLDFSLQEIAEHLGITRQGVHDAITNAEKTFNEAENILHLIGIKKEFKTTIETVRQMLKDKKLCELEILLNNILKED